MASYTEAPASFTVKYQMGGYDCMLTLRSESGKELLPRALAAVHWLQARGAEPENAPAASNGNGSHNPDWCPIHNVTMRRHQGDDGAVWYSHKVDGQWCRGKAKKNSN